VRGREGAVEGLKRFKSGRGISMKNKLQEIWKYEELDTVGL
jgi:hypothetical protein